MKKDTKKLFRKIGRRFGRQPKPFQIAEFIFQNGSQIKLSTAVKDALRGNMKPKKPYR